MTDIDIIKEKWQKKLKLNYWDIKIKIVSPTQTQQMIALVSCYPDKETATIWINSQYKYLSGYNKAWTLESVILHELIHILLWRDVEDLPENIKNNNKFQDFYEYVCDLIADYYNSCKKRV